ncbi:MAG: hypothetical protein K8J31_08415, partial [Anaerolineae bacterium]|nr:hypothetical protein [Anaerolineae bacterium]
MQSLAAEENIRLVRALARLISAQVEIRALQSQSPGDQVPVESLNLDSLFDFGLSHSIGSYLLLDKRQEKVLFSKGELPPEDAIRQMPGVSAALAGGSGALFSHDTMNHDVI